MIKGKMEQQLSVLKELDELITRSDTDRKTGTATTEDIEHLRKYISDMRRACDTAIAIEAALAANQKEKAEAEAPAEEKPAKRRTRAKKTSEPAPVPEPDITEAAAESTEPEDDDLSFLD